MSLYLIANGAAGLTAAPRIQKNKFARIRVTSGANYGVYCYMVLDI